MITSTANSKIKEIRKIHDRKYRQESGKFYLEGLRIVGEAIEQQIGVETLIIAPELLKSSYGLELIEKAHRNGIEVLEVNQEVFKSLSLKEGPQGIAALAKQLWYPLNSITVNNGSLWIALDAIQDPGNLGTILRTSDACGAQGVILLDHSTDPYDDGAVRASMGALFTQKLVKASFSEFKTWKVDSGFAVIGTSGAAKTDYQGLDYPSPMVLLMGSERSGLQDWHVAVCDEMVSIPMIGRSDSLNLAVATGIVLYEIFNQRRKRRDT